MSIIKSDDNDFHTLIERLKDGDETAFEEIYKRCCAPISFLCQKFCDNKEDAEEVVQDTFLIAHRKVLDLRGETLLAYLRKIAIHECFRKRSKNRLDYEYLIHTDSIAETLPEQDESFLPEEALQNKELQKQLLMIINQLPKNRREMVYLYYYASFSTEEIARLYDCTSSTVRNTLSAARKTIKTKFEGTDSSTVKGLALMPLSAVLIMEEQVFAASYVPMAAPSIAATNAVVTAAAVTAKSATGYIIAACITAACGISLATYLVLSPDVAGYEPAYYIYNEVHTQVDEQEIKPNLHDAQEPIEDEESEYEPQVYEQEIYEPHAEEPYEAPEEDEPYEPYQPQAAEEPPYEPPPVEEPQAVEESIVYEPVAEEEHYEPEEAEEPNAEDEPDEPEPEEDPELIQESEPTDRTPEILAALAAANNVDAISGFINYYGFVFDTQIQMSTDLRFRFYVTNEGSGDILIGIATYEGSSVWRMRFEHFAGGQMPADRTDLFQWMSEV